jgi:putative monooxygenase
MEAQEQAKPGVRKVDETAADNRRGGDVRTLLSPKSVGSTSGFMGVATIPAGDWISEHYHPYSEEFIYVCTGTLTADLDGEAQEVNGGEALYIPINVKHRLRNEGSEDAFIVFHLGPLAPRPDIGHVDTEERNP